MLTELQRYEIEHKIHEIRNEIKRHKLTISLTMYKIEILNMQLELTSYDNFDEYEDEEEGFYRMQFNKFVKYNDRLQACNEQICKLKQGLRYQNVINNRK